MTMSLDLLAGRAPAEAVVLAGPGVALSPTDIRRAGEPLRRVLADRRQLVQLVAGRSVETLIAYLVCLHAGHSVLLADERLQPARLEAMREAFRPDVIVGAAGAPPAGYRERGYVGRAAVFARDDGGTAPPEEVAVLLPTSGSLGGFRTVCLSSTNLRENAAAIGSALALRPDDVAGLSLPIGFSYGLSVVNSTLLAGGRLGLPGGSPTTLGFWRDFGALGCTTFAGVPETYRLLTAAGHDWEAVAALRLATQAGGRMPADRVIELADALRGNGAELAVMYGQTEATARITCHRGESVRAAPHAAGAPVPGVRVRISEDPEPDRTDGTGEVVVTGPGVMLGYARSRADLDQLPKRPPIELRTGDLGRWDGSLLEIRGRTARRAKPLGVRVDLDEVENAFAAYGPAAVVADGDHLVVYVEGDEAAYRTAYTRLLRAYLLPPAAVRMRTVQAIPRTVTGKVAYGRISRA